MLYECTTAKNTSINESNAFNGAGRGAKNQEKKYKYLKTKNPKSEFRNPKISYR